MFNNETFEILFVNFDIVLSLINKRPKCKRGDYFI